MKKELKVKDTQIKKLDTRVTSVEEQQKIITEMVGKMHEKVFALERVLAKIDSLDPKLKEYYNILYNTVINHFLAYRVCSTGFFSTKSRSFSTHGKYLHLLHKVQPIIKKLPIVGELAEIPFQIMEKYS